MSKARMLGRFAAPLKNDTIHRKYNNRYDVVRSSNSMNWRTPQTLFDQLDSEFHFQLDAAASKENAKCEHFFTKEDDALKQDWSQYGSVFCNPPYGREIGKFVQKAHDEANKGATVVMLIPARTDTKWFHDYIMDQAEVRFLRGRLKFADDHGVTHNYATFASIVVVFRGGKNG